MRILVIRLLGFGDVAAILVPAVAELKARHPEAIIDVMTFGPGVELMTLVPGVQDVLAITAEQWPQELMPAVASFSRLADVIIARHYDRIINLDTWFMPCFLASLLAELGQPVEGNRLRFSLSDVMARVKMGMLTQDYFSNPRLYMKGATPWMALWHKPWWENAPETAYPEFYLTRCFGFRGPLDWSVPIEQDYAFRQSARGRPMIALSLTGSRDGKRYPHAASLTMALQDAGFYVWSQFDGSLPVAKTLGRLAVSDLLLSVATSSQWLARMAGCDVLMISGSLPPSVLGADYAIPQHRECQYCYQMTCAQEKPFACLDIAPAQVVARVQAILATKGRKAARLDLGGLG